MFEALTRIFSKPETEVPEHEPQLAVAALLVHLAAVDGQMNPAERAVIKAALTEAYDMDEAEVEQLIREATVRDAEAVDFYRFTSALSSLELEERLEIIAMMWRVVFTDKANHELEDNMVWRVAELIGVSSRDRTVLRSRIAKEAKNAG